MPDTPERTAAVVTVINYSQHIWEMCEMEQYEELMLEFVEKNHYFVMAALLRISPRLTKMRRDDLLYAIASQFEVIDK